MTPPTAFPATAYDVSSEGYVEIVTILGYDGRHFECRQGDGTFLCYPFSLTVTRTEALMKARVRINESLDSIRVDINAAEERKSAKTRSPGLNHKSSRKRNHELANHHRSASEGW